MSVTCQSGQSIKSKPYSFPFIILSKLRFFPLFCCRYYFIVCLPSHKASHLERVHLHALFTLWEGHSFPSSTTLRMLLKKPITMLMFLLMLLPLLKVLYSFFGYEWTVWIQTKSFLCLFFISSWQVYRYSPAQSSLLHEIQCAIACRTGWLLRRFSRQTEALRAHLALTCVWLKSILLCSLSMAILRNVGLHPYLHYLTLTWVDWWLA